ncbi:MAG: hypothetical protein GF368_02485 [Candidatus Aenigmarchaeota archaeon]|nr:hypothetical protein [Candidatus Aenigmarchaeota archaeon]
MADKAIRICLPKLPDGINKAPIYYGISLGARFLIDTNNHGLDVALKNTSKRVVKEVVISEIVESTWDTLEEQVTERGVGRPLMGYAEGAYKSTMTRILNEGADAL